MMGLEREEEEGPAGVEAAEGAEEPYGVAQAVIVVVTVTTEQAEPEPGVEEAGATGLLPLLDAGPEP